tara:strand:+ start:410 stop:793 length:384 start_codon:yes stop_codon:yes gene_type:complete
MTKDDEYICLRELIPDAYEGDEFMGSFSIDATESSINVNALGDFEPDPIKKIEVKKEVKKKVRTKKLKTWVEKMREEELKRNRPMIEKRFEEIKAKALRKRSKEKDKKKEEWASVICAIHSYGGECG